MSTGTSVAKPVAKFFPFATEFCDSKSQRVATGGPVSRNLRVLQNSPVRQLSGRRSGAAGGDGHRARAGSSCRYVGFLFRCYSDPMSRALGGEYPGFDFVLKRVGKRNLGFALWAGNKCIHT